MSDDAVSAPPWDLFINLLAVFALYLSVIGTITLTFAFISLRLPDKLSLATQSYENIRVGAAMLLVFFPVYVWAWRSIAADFAAKPFKKTLWFRTCPIYLTIFLAGLVIFCDLAYFVYCFLDADLTASYLLRTLTILTVSGVVLYFYLRDLRRMPGPLSPWLKAFATASCMAVAALAAVAIVIAGPPSKARAMRTDQTRVGDLKNISTQVVEYRRDKQKLPDSVASLNDWISHQGNDMQRDPATEATLRL